MENLRVLEGSEVFFRGLQHQYAPVQIRSAPLLEPQKSSAFEVFCIYAMVDSAREYLNWFDCFFKTGIL